MEQYDPNIWWAEHRVRVTFMQWDYQLTVETKVKGNCKGFTILESAVENIFESLESTANADAREARLELTRPNGEVLEVEVYIERDLYDMIIKIEIVDQKGCMP